MFPFSGVLRKGASTLMSKKLAKTAKAPAKGEKVILLYSGGLDTSVIVRWLADQGYRVVCVTIDVGQQESLDLEQFHLLAQWLYEIVRVAGAG